MGDFMTASAQWRTLAPDELRAMPEARLSGPLGLIVWSAAALALLPVVFVLGAVALTGPNALGFIGGTFLRPLFGGNISDVIAALGFIPVTALFVWGAVTALMGFSRSPSTPQVSSILLIVWAAVSILTQVAIRYALMNMGSDMLNHLNLLPYIVFDIAIAAAYWGYMHDSRAANVYFQRRVRT